MNKLEHFKSLLTQNAELYFNTLSPIEQEVEVNQLDEIIRDVLDEKTIYFSLEQLQEYFKDGIVKDIDELGYFRNEETGEEYKKLITDKNILDLELDEDCLVEENGTVWVWEAIESTFPTILDINEVLDHFDYKLVIYLEEYKGHLNLHWKVLETYEKLKNEYQFNK
ncbi:hypothetical protein ACNQ2O_01295 [Mycoplasma sp. AA7A]|uniref:hypothetical protein n=1 Tax=Mycoplasma sp. AA7A TaxID=3401665 RepID=UPI003AAD5991